MTDVLAPCLSDQTIFSSQLTALECTNAVSVTTVAAFTTINFVEYRVETKSDYTFLAAYTSGTTGRTVKLLVPIARKSHFRYGRVGLRP